MDLFDNYIQKWREIKGFIHFHVSQSIDLIISSFFDEFSLHFLNFLHINFLEIIRGFINLRFLAWPLKDQEWLTIHYRVIISWCPMLAKASISFFIIRQSAEVLIDIFLYSFLQVLFLFNFSLYFLFDLL